MTEPVLIGLCGRSGTGKGYVCGLFDRLGIPSVDTDAVYRKMTAPSPCLSPCMQELSEVFGERIVLPDHSLNRSVMREIVFSEGGDESRRILNRITHAHILCETMSIAREYAESGKCLVIIDAPLLFESGFASRCRFTVCVTASTETSVRRIMQRDSLTRADALRRLSAQMPEEELIRRCDYRIINELYSDTLEEQVAAVAESIRHACRS